MPPGTTPSLPMRAVAARRGRRPRRAAAGPLGKPSAASALAMTARRTPASASSVAEGAGIGAERRLVVGVDRGADGEVGDALGGAAEPPLEQLGRRDPAVGSRRG